MATQILPDFPPGPLDEYRKRASFDWKKLKIYLYTEDVIKFEEKVVQELKKNPIFEYDYLSSLSLDEERKKAYHQQLVQRNMDILRPEKVFMENMKFVLVLQRNLQLLTPNARIKAGVHIMFVNVVQSLGTQRHEPILKGIEEGKILGCFCLTEIGHGSNTQGMRTIANYDKTKKLFILNSPDFEAAKCWSGSLGQTATHGLVYAQLYIDNKPYGLHTFVVPLRDPDTFIAYPGVIVGDMGEKLGLNGIDNGFVMFDNYQLPRESLLNKTADVTEDGQYVSPIKNAQERYSASFGILSLGRVSICSVAETYGIKALTIAVRYAAVRKQFNDPEDQKMQEVPIIEYQSHQYRLLPFLAAAYTFRIFDTLLMETYYQFRIECLGGTSKHLADLGMEIHSVSSVGKVLATWTFRDAAQECREACGGHGYLKYSGLGDARNNLDPALTYEGENHVLIQQTSNWLLSKIWPAVKKGLPVSAPMKSIDFLSNLETILKNNRFSANTIDEICDNPKTIIESYQWLVCYYLVQSADKIEKESRLGSTQFWVKNNSQVFYAKHLAITYLQHFILQKFLEVVDNSPDENIRKVLGRIFSLYGLWSLDKFLATLYEGGFASGPSPSKLIHESILKLCRDLKDDSVALIDTLAPHDYILNSVLGASDGEIYKRLRAAMMQSAHSMSRPNWLKDFHDLRVNNSKM